MGRRRRANRSRAAQRWVKPRIRYLLRSGTITGAGRRDVAAARAFRELRDGILQEEMLSSGRLRSEAIAGPGMLARSALLAALRRTLARSASSETQRPRRRLSQMGVFG